jgi:hypothetical protein
VLPAHVDTGPVRRVECCAEPPLEHLCRWVVGTYW